MRFTLYPIYWVAERHLDPLPFDHNLLPYDIAENVRIESVAERFRPGTFDLGIERYGSDIREELEDVQYALVHRYEPRPLVVENGDIVNEVDFQHRSETLVRNIMACLRLIRPMRSRALLMRGNVRVEDGSFDVTGYDVPPQHLLEVPQVQKLFKLRNRDCADLRRYTPEFLRGMTGEFWKFRMAVQFHELGHFQALDWKARYLLWGSAIESIFTSNSREHQGTLVAMERIKWFIGANTSIYAPGDLNEFEDDPDISVGDIVNAWYNVRNHLAHGDRIPDLYFLTHARQGLNGGGEAIEVLFEAGSFIIRTSLLKILTDGLLDHFTGAAASDAFFEAHGLTNQQLRARARLIP